MAGFYEYRYYDGALDGEAVRLSMFDSHGREFWRAVPGGEGRAYRERRDDALRAIWGAISDGHDPGEVRD